MESLPTVLAHTRSLCPECFAVVEAARVQTGEDVHLVKRCPEHGEFRAVLWRGAPAFSTWLRPKKPSSPKAPITTRNRGCPFDCGLCEEHAQHSCAVLLEVTHRCDLVCPVCFADAGGEGRVLPAEPSLDEIDGWLATIQRASGDCVIQLSGGEPTMRPDLPTIIRRVKQAGFFVQLNTNGLRLGREAGFAASLKDAGLDSVYLQCDGVSDDVHRALRGRPLADAKRRAMAACAEANLGVVLVATVAPGVNDHEMGALLRLGVSAGPTVRGVHFQPLSSFGRYPDPHTPTDAQRITLPELMRGLEAQTAGLVHAADFIPPACEHALCSFHAAYVREGTDLRLLSRQDAPCCTPKAGQSPRAPERIDAAEGARRAKAFTRQQWAAPAPATSSGASLTMDDFLAVAKRNAFSVSAMAFQDVWTIDLERVRGCCIHCMTPDGRLVPFCAYNCTAADGRPLHRTETMR